MHFLVTAIGSFSAACVIHRLKAKGHYVVGCDIYDYFWLADSKECDAFYQAPYATDEDNYIRFLLDASTRENVKYIIPLTDLEIDILNKHRNLFADKGIVLCMQSDTCLSIARNKYNLYLRFVNDNIVNVPKTALVEKVNGQFSIPAIAKPINGRSSEGLHKIYTTQELKFFVDTHSDYVVQEMLEGPVFTVDYVRDSAGNDFSMPREELLRTKNGAGTTVRILNDTVLAQTVSHIGNELDICGCVNMEFISNSGKYYLIDINPRFSAGIAFTYKAGYDIVTSHINCFTGSAILSPVRYKEQIIIKKYVEEILWSK